MGNFFGAAMVELLENVAVFSLTAIAYASLVSILRCAPARSREIAGGVVFGLGAIFCMTAQHYVAPSAYVTEGSVAVMLAAPFAGSIAGVVAAVLAAGFFLLLAGAPAYPGLAELVLAALLGIAGAEFARRKRMAFGGWALVVLAGAQVLGSVALLLPKLGLTGLTDAIAWAVAVRQPAGIFILGLLLLRWGNTEKRLAESERRWHALVANVPGAVLQISLSAAGEIRFPYVSLEAAKVFGESALEAPKDAAKILGLLHPDDRTAFKRSLADASQRLSPWSLEFRILDPQGKARWLRGRALPYADGHGSVLWDGIVVNVTSRKDVEKALRLSEDLYRLLAENTTEVIARIGPDGKWIYVSPPARHILGYEPAELTGQSWRAIIHPDEVERIAELVTPLAPGEPPVVLSYRAQRKDGIYLWVEDTRRIAGKSGLAERYETISVIRPVTRRRSEARPAIAADAVMARERSAVFARLLEATKAGVIVTDPHQPDNPIVFANAAAAAITGYEAEALLGRNCRMLQGADSDRDVVEEIRRAVREERSIAATLINYRKDGTPFWSKLDISPVRGADGALEAFVSVFVDVTEQKRVEDELRHARDAAEQANQAKSDFIANISHELRTPLNGVIGFTNLLLNENLPAEQRRYATFARDAGSSLLAIINNVLDLSKIEAGRLELSETDFSVIELAVSCNTVVWHAAREKGLDLNFVLKPDVISVACGDPDRIRQVLLNLLSNAIKFTAKGNVVLAISKAGDTPAATVLRFSVTDTGVGIAKEKQPLLFQKFSQLDDGAGRHFGGSGLGLAICKSLVERMGGKIGVTSKPGLGSKFWFTVPLKPAADAARRFGDASAAPRRRARILLVEDMPMNQELMITLLRRAGHEVDTVGDGEAALAAVKGQAFDVVLMDLQLPRMDGLAATKAIRALEGSVRNIPIIAMTARALSKDVEQCLAAGMNDHLPKPIDAAALLAVIDHWTRSRDPLERGAAGAAAIQDPVVLGDLERHLGHDRVAAMMASASADIPHRLDRIGRHLSDHALVEREAHELVSVVGNLGFTELTACARRLMETSGRHDDAQIRAASAALQAAAARALPVMGSLPKAGAAD